MFSRYFSLNCIPSRSFSSSSSVSTKIGPLKKYDELLRSGKLRDDSHQRSIVSVINELYEDLEDYEPSKPGILKSKNWISSIFGKNKDNGNKAPKGLYLHGDVGTGKTMLMDLFYHSVDTKRKRRVHFNSFMLSVHQQSHELKSKHSSRFDPIPTIASSLVSESWLLCFDEFQVTDIADAMILRRLFEELFSHGMVMFTTSNRHPDELYKNGIQRQSFIPCIELIKKRCNVYNLDSGVDNRKMERTIGKGYFYPLSEANLNEFEGLFRKLVSDSKLEPKKISLLGRSLHVPTQCAKMKVAKFSFEDLCCRSLSAADYLEIVKYYDVIFMEGIPKLGFNQRNEARRFITLLDTLYENRIKLICTAEVQMEEIFAFNEYDSTEHDEAFSFRRSLSRLKHMQSEDWLKQAHHE